MSTLIVTVQVAAPLQAPSQAEKDALAPAAAVSVTCVPSAKLALQIEPQSMPPGDDVTVPPPLVVTVSR
ncbi:MAG: hypothetical protein E6J88_04455 [Deltaproteobacteria bacterium]|nr:MAG: hypothetical protein E6J88_04455 [Deltaproteobacteria bacterium]